MRNIWAYGQGIGYRPEEPMAGFTVEAADGTIGHVDRQEDRPGAQHLVVDTGVWVFGKSLLIPAGVVHAVNHEAQSVTVSCTRDQIKNAPVFSRDSETKDAVYLTAVRDYYEQVLPPAEV